MIHVMVGLKHGAQTEPTLDQPFLHRIRLGGINNRCLVSTNPDPDHIVLECGKSVER